MTEFDLSCSGYFSRLASAGQHSQNRSSSDTWDAQAERSASRSLNKGHTETERMLALVIVESNGLTLCSINEGH
jgi:hypothetical protein